MAAKLASYDGDNAFTDMDERDESRREHYRDYARIALDAHSAPPKAERPERLTPEEIDALLKASAYGDPYSDIPSLNSARDKLKRLSRGEHV